MSCCTIVFAKNPVPGQVKTRLLSLLSPEGAASLYQAFLVDWCKALSTLSASDLVVAYTPPDSLHDLKTLIGEGGNLYPPRGFGIG